MKRKTKAPTGSSAVESNGKEVQSGATNPCPWCEVHTETNCALWCW